jgi:hypothetical protein
LWEFAKLSKPLNWKETNKPELSLTSAKILQEVLPLFIDHGKIATKRHQQDWHQQQLVWLHRQLNSDRIHVECLLWSQTWSVIPTHCQGSVSCDPHLSNRFFSENQEYT